MIIGVSKVNASISTEQSSFGNKLPCGSVGLLHTTASIVCTMHFSSSSANKHKLLSFYPSEVSSRRRKRANHQQFPTLIQCSGDRPGHPLSFLRQPAFHPGPRPATTEGHLETHGSAARLKNSLREPGSSRRSRPAPVTSPGLPACFSLRRARTYLPSREPPPPLPSRPPPGPTHRGPAAASTMAGTHFARHRGRAPRRPPPPPRAVRPRAGDTLGGTRTGPREM